MADSEQHGGQLSEANVAALAERLADYAGTLSERERALLATIMARALDPVDRVRFYPPPTTLSAREEAFVQALLDADSTRAEGSPCATLG